MSLPPTDSESRRTSVAVTNPPLTLQTGQSMKITTLILTVAWLAPLAALRAGAVGIANDLHAPGDEPRPTVRAAAGGVDRSTRTAPTQYLLFNRAPGQGMYQGSPESLGRRQFEEVLARFPNRPAARVQTGVSHVFSPLRTSPETTVAALRTFLDTAQQTATPVLVQIDLEHWWDARPDLWNWWDSSQAGYDPANRENVEWTGGSPDDAINIAWRNWGQQIRVLPPPNLASPRYLSLIHISEPTRPY